VSESDRSAIQTTPPKPRRKWRRRALWFLVIGPLGLIAAVLIIGQTSLMQVIVEPILEDQMGVDVSTGSVRLSATGEIVIVDAACEASRIDSAAGSLIEFKRATISVNWWGVIKGSGQVHSIVIEQPIVRVSQDIETGVLNLAAMEFKQGGGGGATPAIEITNGIFEIGEHDQGSYRVLKEFSFKGQLSQQTSDGISGFDFIALPKGARAMGMGSGEHIEHAGHGSIGLTGQISKDGIDGVLDGVRLEDWPADIVPSRSRGLYAQLDLAGDLAPTRFHVSQDGLVEIVLMLDGVALNLPIEEADASRGVEGEGDAQMLRMRQTRGVIRFGTSGLNADIKGLIDELEYDVMLDYQGLEATSPFDAMLVTDFRLDEAFKPARFLPANVMSKLDRFENPIADVHAQVHISRGAGRDARIAVSGKAELSNGSAIYKKFRYPFRDLSGVIEFDPDQLVIRDIIGVGPTGARLVANGVFSPLGEQSVVNLMLNVKGVAIDQHLINALDGDQRDLVDALFSETDYAELLDDGLVLTQDDADALGESRRAIWDRLDRWEPGVDGSDEQRRSLARELASIDRQLLSPVFSFGAVPDVDVELVRHPERASDDRWTTDVRVKLPQAGLVSEHFPLPINAHDVEIVINEKGVELTGGRYTGLTGGRADVEVKIDLTKRKAKPIIKIQASDFPIDARLIAAIPGYHDPQSEDPDDITLRRILDRLNLAGVLDCDAIIGPRGDGRLGYDIESTVLKGSAHPQTLTPGDDLDTAGIIAKDPLALNDIYGTVYITEDLIIVDLDAMLSSPELPLAPTPIEVLTQLTLIPKDKGPRGARRVGGLLPTDFGPPVPGPTLYASARAEGIDLAMPLEHAIAVISPKVARDLLKKKAEYNPDGLLALEAQFEGIVGGAIDTTLTIDRFDQFGLDLEGSRYELGSSWGRVQIVLADEPTIDFDGFRVSIQADGEDAGTLALDGSMPLVRAGRVIEITKSSALELSFDGGRFDSPIAKGVIDRLASAQGESWFDAHQIGGRFDLGVTLSPKLGVHRARAMPGDGDREIMFVPTMIHGTLSPKSFTIDMGEQSAEFDEIVGEIKFDGFDGTIENIRAADDSVSLTVNGGWSVDARRGVEMQIDAIADGALLTGPVRAILPVSIDRVINRLAIRSDAPMHIDNFRFIGDALGKPDAKYSIVGDAQLSNGSALVGLEITEIEGDLGFRVEGTPGAVGYEINLDAKRLRAGLMRMSDARVQVIGDANSPGVVLVPEISASMHSGQIAGSAQIRPGEDSDDQYYWVELHASGVRVAPMFDDLLLPEGLEGPPREGQSMVRSVWNQGDDRSRGILIADLTLTGPIGDPTKRSGRGLARVSGGSVVALPGLIQLIEASNLSMPAGSPLDMAQASFYVDGQTLAFEQISASSKRIEILGYGTLDWATRALDLRFRSRAVHPIPVISSIIEQLRDELITTRVTGKLGEPKYSAEQFGSTMRLFNAMLGNAESDLQRRMREVEDQVRASRMRTLENKAQRVHYPVDEQNETQASGWEWADEVSGDEK